MMELFAILTILIIKSCLYFTSINSLTQINFPLLPQFHELFPQNTVRNMEFMGQWQRTASLCLVVLIHHQTAAERKYAALPIFLTTVTYNYFE